MAALVAGPLAFELDAVLMQPRTAGRPTLVSTDPRQQPAIALDVARDPVDLGRLMAGLRRAWAVAQSPEMAQVVSRVAGIDQAVLASDSALAAYVLASVSSFCHASGTAPMGPADDPSAVVDAECRLLGAENLWVVDASVLPTPLRVPPHLTTVMLAERAADLLTRGRGDQGRDHAGGDAH